MAVNIGCVDCGSITIANISDQYEEYLDNLTKIANTFGSVSHSPTHSLTHILTHSLTHSHPHSHPHSAASNLDNEFSVVSLAVEGRFVSHTNQSSLSSKRQ